MLPDFLQTNRKENFISKRRRWLMNLYPMFFGTGGKIIFWSSDHQELHVILKRNIWTYNLVGTIFGGSMFAAADPFYMVMFHCILGKEFVVWDKSASIRFRKPARKKMYLKFEITDTIITDVKEQVALKGSTELTLQLQWKDSDGIVYAEIERLIYIADKKYYEQRKGETQAVKLRS
jgi:acyl-coenzyme A thioesterase PaaI-like protein